ncbi:MAG: radical SAM protein [Candidatus Bathyarchaeota archaeon]|nr:radical SAM protein [Candidatus Bathyarchaeota archaeon]
MDIRINATIYPKLKEVVLYTSDYYRVKIHSSDLDQIKRLLTLRGINYREYEGSPLEEVVIELTHDCNLRCLHCSVDGGTKKEKIPKEKIIEILNQLHALGVFRVSFTGGEIFTYEDIFDILEYTNKLGLFFSIKTNGTLFDREIVKRLREFSPSSIEISLDGHTSELHEMIRGRDTFNKTVNTIRMLESNEMPVCIYTVMHKALLPEIPSMLAFLQDIGIKTWHLNELYPLGRANNIQTFYPTITELFKTVRNLVNINEKIKLEGCLVDIFSQKDSAGKPPCENYKGYLRLIPYKQIILAQVYPMIEKPKFVLPEKVNEFWIDERIKELKSKVFPNELCSSCTIEKYCSFSEKLLR